MARANTGAERREAERFQLRRRTVMTVVADGESRTATIDDLSWGGARLRVIPPLPDDRPIVLLHPTAGEFAGQPVWRDGAAVGVRFAEPAQALERTLQCVSLMLYRDEFAT